MSADYDAHPQTSERHTPVLLDAAIDLLGPAVSQPGAVLVDGTLGMGGHSEAFLNRFDLLTVVGIDRDQQALDLARERLSGFKERFVGVHSTYDRIPEILDDLGRGQADAILLDLGVSSMQIDEPDRGFSYRFDGPLDMRMDQDAELTAAEVLNTYSVGELTRILRTYGEERFAQRIAQRIVARRESRPWSSSADLAQTVRDAIPAATRKTGGNPAKRTFQALRIEVNAELKVLEDTLPAALSALAVGGRFGVMSYHSLEDRMVKRAFSAGAVSQSPHGLPVELEQDKPFLRLITRGAMRASEAETAANSRAASVRFRVAERIGISPNETDVVRRKR